MKVTISTPQRLLDIVEVEAESEKEAVAKAMSEFNPTLPDERYRFSCGSTMTSAYGDEIDYQAGWMLGDKEELDDRANSQGHLISEPQDDVEIIRKALYGDFEPLMRRECIVHGWVPHSNPSLEVCSICGQLSYSAGAMRNPDADDLLDQQCKHDMEVDHGGGLRCKKCLRSPDESVQTYGARSKQELEKFQKMGMTLRHPNKR